MCLYHQCLGDGYQGSHQFYERDEIDRGDGLAAALLLLLALLLGRGGWLAGMVEPEVDEKGAARCALHDLNLVSVK